MFQKTTFKSSIDQTTITLYKAKVKNPKAIVHFVHGSVDYASRYQELTKYFNQQGFSVYLMDIRGHGETAKNKVYGFFDKKDGASLVLNDVHDVNKIIKEENENPKIILFGFSMGSFVVRAYATKYQDIDLLIPCGTNHTPRILVSLLQYIAGKKSKHNGDKAGLFITNLTYKPLNKKFKSEGDLAWLSTNQEIINNFMKAPYKSFMMTNRAFYDMAQWMKMFQNKSLAKQQLKIPILLINGQDDPVGAMGKQVKKAFKFYKKYGFNVHLIQYPSLRHVILNGPESIKVFQDIINWINQY